MGKPKPPSKLGKRAQDLWALLAVDEADHDDLVLIGEACRVTDRLDRLDRIVTGETSTIAELTGDLDGTTFFLVVNQALSEARQQQLALKALLSEIRIRRAARPAKPQGVSELATITAQLPAGVTDIGSARAARRP